VFFLAGFETSSTVLSFTLLELAANPDVQRKAQLEIDEALGQNNGEITYESLRDMKYLDWVLQGTHHQNEFKNAFTPISFHRGHEKISSRRNSQPRMHKDIPSAWHKCDYRKRLHGDDSKPCAAK
jgi:hypothetical protein